MSVRRFIQYSFLIGLLKVGASWIYRKGGILEKGGGMTHPLPTMDTFLEINSTRSIERPEHKAPLFAFTKIDLIADNYSSTFLHFLCQQSSFLVSSALNICFSSFAIFYKALHVNVNLCSLLNISMISLCIHNR